MSISDKNPKSGSREPYIQASSRAYPGVCIDPRIQEIETVVLSHSSFLRTMPPKFGQIGPPEHQVEISRTTYPGVLASIPQCAQSSQHALRRSPSRNLFLLRKYHVFEVWPKSTHDVTPQYITPGHIRRPGLREQL